MSEAWTDDALEAFRAATYAADGPALLALLRAHGVSEVLQQCGDVLTTALGREVTGAGDMARRCATALRQRDWPGDEVLAPQLDDALGVCAVPASSAPASSGATLRPVPVDLDQLSDLLEGDPVLSGGRVHLASGECHPAGLEDGGLWSEGEAEVWDDEAWLPVPALGWRAAYRDMEDFIATMQDQDQDQGQGQGQDQRQDLARFLSIAIQVPGAFRRFKNTLAASPEQLRRYWLFAAERQLGRARDWLADEGYRPAVAMCRE